MSTETIARFTPKAAGHATESDIQSAGRPLARTKRTKFFTIGYGGRKPAEFAGLLKAKGIRTVVDVRLRPDRACMGAYVKAKAADKGIEALLRSIGIAYSGCVELGNVFMDEKEFPEWRQLYAELLLRAGDMLVGRIAKTEGPFCLLCCEKDVTSCHRQQIADYLEGAQGFEVEHL